MIEILIFGLAFVVGIGVLSMIALTRRKRDKTTLNDPNVDAKDQLRKGLR